MISSLYVSLAAIEADRLMDTLADIQTKSVARNSALDITGWLIATPTHFAQLFEGPADAIDSVMDKIANDNRHRDVRVLARTGIDIRSCPTWRSTGFLRGSFEERHVTPLLARVHAHGDADGAESLHRLGARFLSLPAHEWRATRAMARC